MPLRLTSSRLSMPYFLTQCDMNNNFQIFTNKYADDEALLNNFVVQSFARSNNYVIPRGCFLSHFTEDTILPEIIQMATIEDVIKVFELAIPKGEKVSNRAVYTPKFIRDFIVEETVTRSKVTIKSKELRKWLCADISCGCGAFLYTLATLIKKEMPMCPYLNIFRNLYGVDISHSSVLRAKILLALLALSNGEYAKEEDFNIEQGNSLLYDFLSRENVKTNGGFDLIVGNPPYVRSKNLTEGNKQSMALWSTSNCGNADLYIPFFEIALKMLTEEGNMGYITVNTFFKAVNARKLRDFLTSNKYTLDIINFGQELIFEKKLAYTCIVFINKAQSNNIQYRKASPQDIKNRVLTLNSNISYSSLNNHRGWHLNNHSVLDNIAKIENAGPTLGSSFVIRNGLATLANNIYIFKPLAEDDRYFEISYEGKIFPIEKSICKDIIKPNIIKSETDLEQKKEKILFPYDIDCNLYNEAYMQKCFPKAYIYLCYCREALAKRDKGEGDYPEWYAFGRTQALTDHGMRLFFPYMSDRPHFILSKQDDLLMYCGYAIFSDDEKELKVLKRILESKVFDYYIRNTSKPYSTNYFSYAKNYVKNFGVYPFTEEEKNELLALDSSDTINRYVAQRYNMNTLIDKVEKEK